MQSHWVKIGDNSTLVLAGEHEGYLLWPNSRLPFLDREKLSSHPRKPQIEMLMQLAGNGDETALEILWGDMDIHEITLKVSHVS